MIVLSIASLLISLAVFLVVSQVVYGLNPANVMFAEILVILLSTLIISLIFAYRQFRYMGKNKWTSPYFHKYLIRTFLINFVIIFIISFVW